MIIVNRSNPVDALTVQQIADMYTGRITNWKEVGGDDVPIICHLPFLPNSPTVQWWTSSFLDGKPLSDQVVVGHRWNAIAYRVGGPISGTPGAIGFIRSRDLHRLAERGEAGMLKVLRIRKDAGDDAELPRLGAHGRTDYPLQRPLYAYYDGNAESKVAEEFVRFLAGAAGAGKDPAVRKPKASK
jgi:phosphate transport system substrate-binding protein